jgi:DNA polymerase I
MLRPVAEFINTEKKAKNALRYVMKHTDVGVDTETSGLNISKDYVLFWGLATTDRRFCITDDLLPIFEPFFARTDDTKHFTNAKYDLHMLANSGIPTVGGNIVCTRTLDWLLDENRTGLHGLKECIWDHFHDRMLTFKDVFGKVMSAEKQPRFLLDVLNDVDGGGRDKAVEYASRDPWESLRLSLYLQEKLDEVPMGEESNYTLLDHFWEIEEPFTRVLYRMERRGVMIDTSYLEDIAPGISKRVSDIERSFNAAAGSPINLRSPKQLTELFFNGLGVRPTKWGKPSKTTGKKNPSCDKEVVGAWSGGDIAFWDGQEDIDPADCEEERELVQELASSLGDHRKLSKFLSTYVVGLEKWADENFRVHPTLNQSVTVTGRLSCGDPNLQNIPRKENDHFKIRDAFIADGGNILYVADYAQLEMRLMAHFSRDANMIKSILDGTDLHGFTVAEMNMGFSYADVVSAKKVKDSGGQLTPHQANALRTRSAAKAVGFGLIYGIGEVKLGMQLGMPIVMRQGRDGKLRPSCPEAAKTTRGYFGVFPGVQDFIKDTHRACRDMEYVQTYLGRYRRLPTISSGNRMLASQARRQSVNSIIQGSAADVARLAMIKCEFDPDLEAAGVEQLLQVHDELIFEMPDHKDIRRDARKRIQEHMEHPFEEELMVPLPADGSFAVAWGNAH